MNKKFLAIFALALAMMLAFAACTPTPNAPEPTSAPEGTGEPAEPEESPSNAEPESGDAAYELNVAALMGPTGVGMVQLMEEQEAGAYEGAFDANIALAASPDELTGKLITGELDIACLPTNLAAVLYQKTGGGIKLAALNTLGVLYVLEKGESVQRIADLAGRTLLATGEASMPEYILDYILAENGLSDDVDVQYLTEHAELAAKAVAGEVELCILPEPFVSRVTSKNPEMRVALSLTEEWNAATDGTELSMGCIVVRSELLENPKAKAAVDAFLAAYAKSANYVAEHPAEAAKLVVKFGVMDDEQLAAAVIPRCNIVFIDGEAMKESAAALYQVLFAANPKSVGGALPDDAFYYSK
jgi:NitT/TauT family transport system substrate-binding protein